MLSTRAVRFWGLLFPDEVWQLFGLEHPLGGRGFQGYIDMLPQAYDRKTVDEAIAAVPPTMMESLIMWGTPEQIVSKLRAFGEAGLRHVVPIIVSAAVSEQAAQFSVQAITEIAHALQSEEGDLSIERGAS